MKVAVYDQFWSTAGGGEKVAAGIGMALARDHDVVLLTHDDLDLEDLGERLQLDLSGLNQRRIDQAVSAVEQASAEVDLFVNASYTSSARCLAPRGLYYVHFPHGAPMASNGLRGLLARLARPLMGAPAIDVDQVAGFHPEERIARCRVQWTDGDALLRITVPRGALIPLRIDIGRLQAPATGPIPVTIDIDGDTRAEVVVRPRTSRLSRRLISVVVPVAGPDDRSPIEVRLRTPDFVPADTLGGVDRRRLGVPFAGVLAGRAVRARLVRRYPSLGRRPSSLEWLSTYTDVVANSGYTRSWIRRWWGVDAEVVAPPVTLQEPAEKRPVILNVGRFFAAEEGHSKKQLEMVRAFRAMAPRIPGWELHLVGGCSEADRAYLERVRFAAGDAPVRFHVNATGAELRDLYGAASIYWHASGLGEDPNRHPDRFEHFGITTVEAMSACAAPVVIGAAGQAEVVEHAVSGYHFRTIEQLIDLTERLVGDESLRSRLGATARERSRQYGIESFAERMRVLTSR